MPHTCELSHIEQTYNIPNLHLVEPILCRYP